MHTPSQHSFVRAATAEADIAAEVQEQDVHNFQSGMVRIIGAVGAVHACMPLIESDVRQRLACRARPLL